MIAIVGAGMGGLLAAIRLAQAGKQVTVFEARERVGGLAGRLEVSGEAMDGGPYILLDRPGLEWAFASVGERLEDHVDLLRLDEVWRVTWPDGGQVRVLSDLSAMASELEKSWPGSAARYVRFVERMSRIHEALSELQRRAAPKPWDLLTREPLTTVPFLLRPFGSHLAATGLPKRVQEALSIWTRVAGQKPSSAPAPMALVPALVHGPGAWVPRGGMFRVPESLEAVARASGVQFRFGSRVEAIERTGDVVRTLKVGDERVPVEAVVSNAPGVGTYVDLLEPPDAGLNARLMKLPLQSPGVGAWWTADRSESVPFLDFRPRGEGCVLRIAFGAVDAQRARQGRLLAPVDHGWAAEVGADGQRAELDEILEASWWRDGLENVDVLATRIPVEWGQRHLLYRDSMNPVMTAAYMRRGRLPLRSGVAKNLFLAGAANHPGQWVSFCAISGLLAADALLGD